jgi:fructuronate reductase
MVHLGVGAFARGHVLWCTAIAADNDPGPWGVCAVAQRSRTVVDAMRARRWSYDVDLRDDADSTLSRVDVVRDGLVAVDEPERLAGVLASPQVTVVTVTATEAGYPGPVVDQVVAAAAARARDGAGPVSFVVCDNVSSGGDLLRELATEAALSSGHDGAAAWLHEHAAFPNTVVDRVVPAVPDSAQPSVVAEPWFRWVLQDAFAAPRPAWESAGARVVDDVTPWQAAKLHLVNAPHSMLAYLGLACGHGTVHEAVRDDLLRAAVETALDAELVPAVPAADGLSAGRDAADSLRRFANSAVPHRLAQVGSGGSVKLPQRLSAVVDACAGAGRAPVWSMAVVAGWAYAVRRGDVDDQRAADVQAALDGPRRDRARALLAVCGLSGGQVQHDLRVDALTDWLEAWDGDGTRQAAGAALRTALQTALKET